ncbi:unnamed protein product, partial [Prorocentrum cordatum]
DLPQLQFPILPKRLIPSTVGNWNFCPSGGRRPPPKLNAIPSLPVIWHRAPKATHKFSE